MGMKKQAALVMALVLCLMAVGAYADKVTVGAGKDFATLTEAIAATGENNTYEIYGKVVVTGNGFNKAGASTFIGMTEDAELDVTAYSSGSYGNATQVTFKNLTFTTNDRNYKGFQSAQKESFENCEIKGAYWTYADEVSFINCTFYQDDSNSYCLWQYAKSALTLENCKFYSPHKFVLNYNEGDGDLSINAKNNSFMYTADIFDKIEKAAFELDSDAYDHLPNINISFVGENNKVDCRNPRGLYYDKTKNPKGTVVANETGTTRIHEDMVHNPLKAATSEANGRKEHWNCQDCGNLYLDAEGTKTVKEDDLILLYVPELTGVQDLPQTGDNTSLLLWSAMLALAAAGIVVTRKTRLN